MAVIYYPKGQLIYVRDQQVSSSNYESILLQCNPNVVFYFDTSSYMQAVNASQLPITASWALTASLSTVLLYTSSSFASSSFTASYLNPGASASFSTSASYATTASYAVNGGGGGNGPYTLIWTSSTANQIVIDFTIPEQFINIPVAALYTFTASNPPASGSTSAATLFISHSVTGATSSLSFPSTWAFLGSVPTYITNSRVAMLTLKAYGPQYFVGAYAVQF